MTFATRLKNPRRFVALMSALAVLIVTLAPMTAQGSETQGNTQGSLDCVDEVVEQLWERQKYQKQEKTRHLEWRWIREHKDVQGWKYLNGSWQNQHDNNWYEVPAHLIEAANFDPRSVAPSGSVSLSFYSGPNVTVQYEFVIDGPSPYTTGSSPYGAGSIKVDERWSDWSTWANVGAPFYAGTAPGDSSNDTTQTRYLTIGDPEQVWLPEGETPDGEGWEKVDGETQTVEVPVECEPPGHCPDGFSKIELPDDQVSGKSFTANQDYSEVFLVGGPPDDESNQDPDGRFKNVGAVDKDETVSRDHHDISLVCVKLPPPPSGWVCESGEVKYLEDASEYDGTLYDSKEKAEQDPDCKDVDLSVVVSAGVCDPGPNGALGSVNVTIDPSTGATVKVYSDEERTDEVGSTDQSGSIGGLAPGTYYWEIEVADGYTFDGEKKGTVVIEDCDVSVQVSGVCDDVLGTIEIIIDVPGAVTVDIPGVGQFTETTTEVVGDNATYTWTATAQPGFAISGDDSGEVTVPPCAEANAAILVTVDGSCQIVNSQGQGVIDVIISVDDGATVTISDTDGVIDTFTSDASLNVDAGATYTWEATPSEGFEFPPGFEASGTIDIEDCTPPPPPAEQGEIIVQKVVEGDGNRDFEFTFVTGGFTLGDNTLSHGQNSSSGPLAPGTGYSVEEVLPGGWDQLSASCDDGSSPTNIDLSAGEQVTCTFVNTVPALVGASIEVTVDGRCEVDGDTGTGFVDVVISVDNGATVVVRDSAGTVVGTLTEDGTITVAEGATYTWEATPAEGFEFPEGADSSGTITIERCSDLDELPFTGLDLDTMVAFAAALLGAGLLVLGTQLRQREQ